MAPRRALVLGADGLSQVLQPGDALALGPPAYANPTIPAGNTVTATTEAAFASKLTIPAGLLASGWTIALLQWGLYSSSGVTPSITPRIRLGGVSLFLDKAVTGLLGSSGVPWQADATFLVTDQGVVGTGALTIADNQTRIFGGAPVTGINLALANDLTSSAQWGQTGCSITAQGWAASLIPPAS